MTKIEQAAKALSHEDILALTDTQIMDAAHAAGIVTVGRWHLNRIRNARTYMEAEQMLAKIRA